jgi:hypothetical protein
MNKPPQTYKEPGTLPKPGPIGRTVRLILGIASLLFVFFLITDGKQDIVAANLPTQLIVWAGIVVGLYAFSDVIDIGWRLRWEKWPLVAVLVLAGIFGAWSFMQYGSWWSYPLGWFVYIWLFYTFGHLGVAYVLAGVSATPGCEMRSIPYLWALLTGKENPEHACQGLVDVSKIDEWEHRKER